MKLKFVIPTFGLALLTSCTPAPPADPLSEVQKAEASGDLPRAEKLLADIAMSGEAKKDWSTTQHACYALARVYREAGQPDKAIPYYIKFIDIKKNEPAGTYHGMAWNLTELGDLYAAAGQWTLAIPTYKEALDKLYEYARTPDTIHVLNKLAVCYWKDNDESTAKLKFEQAKKNYEQSIAMPSLERKRSFLDVTYAMMLDEWAQLSKSEDIAKQADSIWSELRKQMHLSNVAKKQTVIESVAKHLCQSGKSLDAMFLYDWLNEKDISHVWTLRTSCQRESKKHYSLSTTDAKENPYLKQFTLLKTPQDCFDNRQNLCQNYAWSVPDEAAIEVLLSAQPLVEIGAGTGYWAGLVKNAGGDIVAFDVAPVPSKGNQWHMTAGKQFFDVQPGDETAVRRFSDRTLFLSWPPNTNRCGYNTLRLFRGKRFIYVGEGEGGCTGTQEFHDLLKKEWHLVKRLDIPQWPGVYDQLSVYERNVPVKSDTACNLSKPLGEKLALIAAKSPVVFDDICTLLRRGVKIEFVKRNGAYFDQKTKTIYVSTKFSDSHKLLALSHEYAHAVLNPTNNPIPGKTGRKEFILQGFEQEADAVIHELMAAQELKAAGVPIDKATEELLTAYQQSGRDAVLRYIDLSKNSANEEGYIEHFSHWYDETVPRSSARP
ncbi:MAG: tetratricopeptide repeat protein [Candidatus Obscuribacterales bacterium]|nr:tetratricopeptide repeat protein [Candidatus Obscuribacterales bacterium]